MADIFLIANSNSTAVAFTNGAIWQGGVAPTNTGDVAHILNAALQFTLDLANTNVAALTIGKIVLYDTFTGYFGNTGTNKITIGALEFIVGRKSGTSTGNGADVINYSSGTGAVCAFLVESTKSPPGADTGLPPVRLVSGTAGSSLTVKGGSVGFGVNAISETTRANTVTVSGASAKVILGVGAVLSAVKVSNGTLEANSAVSTLEQTGGTVTTAGNWQMGTATLSGGTLLANHRNSGGTEIQHLKLQGGKLDLTNTGEAFACTATVLSSGTIAQQNASQFAAGTLTMDFKEKRSLTLSLAA